MTRSGTGSPKAAATAAMTWPARAISAWSTATSSTRSRRSPSRSPSTTSTGSSAAAGAATPPPAPTGPGPGPVGYGPNLAAFAVYLMVVHFIPAHRVVALLESLTGTAPSVGFVHGMINRTAGLLDRGPPADPDADHPGVRGVLRRDPAAGRRQAPPPWARRRPSGTCWSPAPSSTPTTCSATGPSTTFKAFVVADLTGSVIVHDRYQNYDSAAARHAGPPVVHRAPAARS